MRRAGLGLLVVVTTTATVHAAPWNVTAEGGAEVDSNVQRVETGPGLMTEPVSAGVMRLGVRADRKSKILGGAYALALSDLLRIVTDDTVRNENVTLLTGDLRWYHQLGKRPVYAGIGVTAADAFVLESNVGPGARTFRNLGADGILVLRSGESTNLTLTAGIRDFFYKPAHDYDWRGPSASVRIDTVLWQSAGKTKSLELAATGGVEARAYNVPALFDACPQEIKHRDPSCSAPTNLLRDDRYTRAGVELTWVGRQVLALGYHVAVIDSNSFGQSLARHRITASATTSFGKNYATLLATLHVDQYLDGLLVQRDLQHAEFTNIEDENRSSLQLRVARKVSTSWSLEGRAAIWRNIAGAAKELSFQRELFYAGLVYAK